MVIAVTVINSLAAAFMRYFVLPIASVHILPYSGPLPFSGRLFVLYLPRTDLGVPEHSSNLTSQLIAKLLLFVQLECNSTRSMADSESVKDSVRT